MNSTEKMEKELQKFRQQDKKIILCLRTYTYTTLAILFLYVGIEFEAEYAELARNIVFNTHIMSTAIFFTSIAAVLAKRMVDLSRFTKN